MEFMLQISFIFLCLSTFSLNIEASTEGSGSSCGRSHPCRNGGSCIEGGDCVCDAGWFGLQCEKKVDTSNEIISIIDANTATMYTLVTKRMALDEATNECKKRFGRVVSNVSDKEVKTALNMLNDKALQAHGESHIEALREFWAIADESIDILPQEFCSISDINGTISKVTCADNAFSVVCAKPTTGYCYPEIAKGMCKAPQDFCAYNRTSANCICREGFKEDAKDKTRCVDIDECSLQWPCNFPTTTVCENTQGAYRCGCSDGKQGNGVDMCGYVITMKQINFDFSKIPDIAINPATNSTTFIKNLDQVKSKIEDKISSIFRISTNSIKKVFVKSISPPLKTGSIVYDIWSIHPDISPTSIKEFYNEAERRGKLFWMAGSKLVEAPLTCTPTRLGLRNKFYNFTSAEPGDRGISKQRCSDGRNIATAECKVKINSDGSPTAYYDYKTVAVIPCHVSLDKVNEMVTGINSTQTAEIAMNDLDSLTSDYTKTNDEMIKQATDSIINVANFVWTTKVDINVATMTSMVHVADNLNKAQKYGRQTNNQAQLNLTQRRDIISALERCSVHVITDKSETHKIETKSVIMQITNALPRNNSTTQLVSGVSFNQLLVEDADTSSGISSGISEYSCQPNKAAGVRSFIPGEVVEKAKKMKSDSLTTNENLAVSFVYFTDSEFFIPHTDKYEIEQVLSAQISNLNLTNLKDPVWFQFPPKTKSNSPKMKRYFKCSYLNEETGEWLSDGCITIPGSDPPNCTCNHMTNFAVLVQTHERLQEYSLEIVGKVCCVISIFGLLFMLLIHLYFPTLRKSDIVKIHSHLGFCLMISYIILLSSTERPKPYGLCITSAAFLHFFLLSSWGWMVVECITMYRKLVTVFSKSILHYVTKAAAGVYGASLIIVLTTMFISVSWYDSTNYGGWVTPGSDFFPSSYVSDRLCWLHSYSLIFGFLIPVAIAFVVSFSGAIIILWSITCGRKQVGSQSNPVDIRSYVLRAITVSVLLGLSWIFAIPLTLSDDQTVNRVFGWLFSITNALQGFFMFILFCVRREDVRKMWIQELKNFFEDENTDNIPASRGTIPDETETAASNDNVISLNPHELPQSSEDQNNLFTMDSLHQTSSPAYSSKDRKFSRKVGKISTFLPTTKNNQNL